jgi:hypothetical protein
MAAGLVSLTFPRIAGAEDAGPGGAAGASVTDPAASAPRVIAERPFRHGERNRPDGAVQASVEDETLARWNAGGSSSPNCISSRAGFHVAPRVKVDAEVRSGRIPARPTKGTLSAVGVLAQTRNHGYWPFRLCYEAGLRDAPRLAGKSRIRLVVNRAGRATAARLLDTELRDREVASCLVSRVRALAFSPGPRERAEVDLTIDLNPGDAPLPDTCRAKEDSEPAEGSLEGAAPVLASALPGIAACYAEGLGRDPGLWGRIAFEIGVSERGAVTPVIEHDSHFPDPAVVTCAGNLLRKLVFPSPHGGPVRLVWGVRLGIPPFEQGVSAAGNPPGSLPPKTLVAEPAPPRLPLGR